jgi:hypothetical protein
LTWRFLNFPQVMEYTFSFLFLFFEELKCLRFSLITFSKKERKKKKNREISFAEAREESQHRSVVYSHYAFRPETLLANRTHK